MPAKLFLNFGRVKILKLFQMEQHLRVGNLKEDLKSDLREKMEGIIRERKKPIPLPGGEKGTDCLLSPLGRGLRLGAP